MAQRETYINKNNSVIEIPAKAPDSEWTQRYIWNVPQTLEQLKINITPMDASEPNVYPTDIILSGFNNVDIVINNNSFDRRQLVKSISNEEDEQLVIQSIGDYAFRNCLALEVFGNYNKGLCIINNIGQYAFENCRKWTVPSATIAISKDIKLGQYAFKNCSGIDFYYALKRFNPETNTVTLITEPFELPIGIFKGTGTTEVLQSNNIPDYCYSNCKRLGTSRDDRDQQIPITIPKNISNIGNYAFEQCIEALEVDFSKVTSNTLTIGSHAFEGCTRLHTATFPFKLKTLKLGEGTFSACTSIKHFVFPEGIKTLTIGNAAFSGCSDLETITFPSSLETLTIGDEAFWGCEKLKNIEIIADDVTIGKGIFSYCEEFTSIKIKGKKTLTIAEQGFFAPTVYDKYLPVTELYLESEKMNIGDNLGVDPDTLETLGADFVTVKNICGSMNRDNNKLKNLYIYQEVNYGNTAKQSEGLKNLSKLTNIYLAEDLGLKLGPGALKNCTSLRKITTLNDTTTITSDQFYINPSLQIEFGSLCFNNVLTSKTTDVTSITFPKLNGVPEGSNLLNYCFGHLKINTAATEGITFNLYDTKIPKNCFNGSNIKTLNVSKDLSEIQDGAFKDCTLLDAIKPIGANTFNSLSYIGENCFNNTALREKDTTNKHWYAIVGNKRVYIDSIEGENSTIVSPECDLVAKYAVRPEVTDITCAFVGNKRIHKEALLESKLLFIFKNNVFNLKKLTLETREGETIKLYSEGFHPALQNLRNAAKILILSPIETFGVCPFSQDIKIETLQFGTDEKVINVPDNFCSRKVAIQNLILNSNSIGASSFAGLTGSLPSLKISTNDKLHFAHRAFYSNDLVIRTLEFNKEIEDWMKNVTAENKTSSPIPYVLKFKTPKYPDGVFRIAPAAELTPQSYTLSNNKFINEIDFTNLKLVDNNKGSLSGQALIHIYGPIETARGLIEETFNLKLDNSPKGKIYKDGEWGDVV